MNTPSLRALARLPLSSFVSYVVDPYSDDGRTLGMVVGVWSWRESGNRQCSREKHFNVDPRDCATLQAEGYLILPNKGGGFIYAFFGDTNFRILPDASPRLTLA